ncbi:MAG: SRPBCC family protein [Microthrixaceae bacterium]|nr:SRPBCC family protein [Microthrixaceae bacterium]
MPADRFTVSQLVRAPADVVWDDLAHIDRHVDWMYDAADITFHGEQRRGVGTTFDCLTVVGPLRTVDRMEITSWVEGAQIGVRHVGLVTGEGVISVIDAGPSHCVVSWTERLRFPWFVGGPVATFAARPVMVAIWRSSLRKLAARWPSALPDGEQ